MLTQARGEGLEKARTFFGLSLETQRDMLLFLVEEHLSRRILETVQDVGEFEGVCDDIDPWTTAIALQTMTIRVAYDHLLPIAGEVEADVDAMARAVSRIWARTVGLEKVASPGAPDGH